MKIQIEAEDLRSVLAALKRTQDEGWADWIYADMAELLSEHTPTSASKPRSTFGAFDLDQVREWSGWSGTDDEIVAELRKLFSDRAADELRRQHQEITELRHGAGVANMTIQSLQKRYADLEAKVGKPWVGLTATEVHETDGYEEDRKLYRFARAIEAKLKEKNT